LSQRQSCLEHLGLKVVRPFGRKLTTQEFADFGGFDIEQFGQGFCPIAVPSQRSLYLVDVPGKHGLDHVNRHRLPADMESGFQGKHHVLAYLQGSRQALGQKVNGFFLK
jgi:hypothetical protein